MKDSQHSFLILLNRPFLLIKSNAIDKAILLWLNYRNTYNYWRKEREKLLVMTNRCYDKNRKNLHETNTPILKNTNSKDLGKNEDCSSTTPISTNFVKFFCLIASCELIFFRELI